VKLDENLPGFVSAVISAITFRFYLNFIVNKRLISKGIFDIGLEPNPY